MSTNKTAQENLIRLGYLDPPADGTWGVQSKAALVAFQKDQGIKAEGALDNHTLSLLEKSDREFNLSTNFASALVRYFQAENYYLPHSSPNGRRYSILYTEGLDPDGKHNGDLSNWFNDASIILEVENGTPKIVFAVEGTCEPGWHYTNKPMNDDGCFRIAFGQYKAWQVGIHGYSDRHESLIQVAPVRGFRDKNKDMKRTGDKVVIGLYGINQHWGYDAPISNIKDGSAGCMLRREREEHRQFMRIVKSDYRHLTSRNYIHYTAIIPGNDLRQRFPFV